MTARKRKRARQIVIHRPKGSTCDLGPRELTGLRAVVCALDAARTTGVAVYIDGRLRAYDECDAHDPNARKQVVQECINAAAVRELPCVLVVEAPWGGYASAALSLTSTVALWRDSWRAAGRSPWHFVELTAGTWRRALFGRGSMTRDAVRQWELVNARARVLADMHGGRGTLKPIGGDAAAAICLGQVASHSSGVRKRVGCDLVTPVTPTTTRKDRTT